MPVGVRVRAGRGIVTPVQDDEGHAANHDQEATEQEGSSLERRMVCHEMLAFYADDDDMCGACCLASPYGCKYLTPIFCTDFMGSFLTSLM